MATETTLVNYIEGAAASTPAATRVVTYAKADGLVYSKDDAGAETLMSSGSVGSVATDPIWDAAGDLVQGTGANTAAKLSAGTAAMFLKSAGAAAANAWAFPPGHEYDYVQITTGATITATTEAGADTVITGSAIAYDGSTVIMIEAWAPFMDTGSAGNVRLVLYDGASSIGFLNIHLSPGAGGIRSSAFGRRRLTPSAATHTYSIRAYVNTGSATVGAGAGGAADYVPAFIRITKV